MAVAVADKEFSGKGKETIVGICQLEGVSTVEMMDTIHDKTAGLKILHLIDEKKYLLHLGRMMSADDQYRS